MNIFRQSIETPWKAVNEALCLVATPLVKVICLVKSVRVGKGAKFYGLPKFMKHSGSEIHIGKMFECRSMKYSSPLGINHATIISTWSKGARIVIGDDVGISGGSIVANQEVTIGAGTIIGANCTIIDTDFHPVFSKARRYQKFGIKTKPVSIGKNVFIGMNSIILKGVNIPDNSVIPAGSVIR